MADFRWFLHRLRTMSLPELGFRARQYAQKQADRRQMGWQPVTRRPANRRPANRRPAALLPQWPAPILPAIDPARLIDLPPIDARIFNHVLNVAEPIDWHLDLSTGRRFPAGAFAKDIDIRTDALGNAKYVWEVNRMPFLPALALHYRQSGNRAHLHRLVALLTDWAAQNPYLTGVNWYSNIEVNLRLINWFFCWNILDAGRLATEDADFGQFVRETWVPLIYQHCVYSRANPSLHSSANNHLVAEYAGLFIASAFWPFTEATTWNAYARAGLEREIVRQHSRGVNREETATYIQFITDFFLLAYVVAQRTNNPFSIRYATQLRQVAQYLAVLTDCRGNLPNYGDQDDGRVVVLSAGQPADNVSSLLASAAVLFGEPLFAQRARAGGRVGFDGKNYLLLGDRGHRAFVKLNEPSSCVDTTYYEHEGHFILRKSDGPGREIYLHVDAAPLGYLSIAAHGHADALSFSLHIDGCVFFGDVGTYTYHTEATWRNYFVSTRAHNTLCIDGENQAFQGGALLWRDHYKTRLLRAQSDEDADVVAATHTGYDRLACHHQRSVRLDKRTDVVTITDNVVNRGRVARHVEVLFHLHPSVQLTQDGDGFRLRHPGCPDREVVLQLAAGLAVDAVRGQTEPTPLGWYSEQFYQKTPTTTLRAHTTLTGGQTAEWTHTIQIHALTVPL